MVSKKKVTNRRARIEMAEPMDEVFVENNTIDTTSVKRMSNKTKIAILLALGVIGIVLYLTRGLFIAATVNGELLSRPTVINDLEKHYGKQALDSLITESLINQEAKKAGITVSNEDIDNEIKTIEDSVKAQGQDLDTLLTVQGMSRDELKKQVSTQKKVEKILGSKVEPTDEEIAEYMKTNKDLLPKDQSEDQVKASVKDQLTQQKLSTEFQTWLAEIKKNANIKYYVNY